MATPTALMMATHPDRIHAALLRTIDSPEAVKAELAALKAGKEEHDRSADASRDALKTAITARRAAQDEQKKAQDGLAALEAEKRSLAAERGLHAETVQAFMDAAAAERLALTEEANRSGALRDAVTSDRAALTAAQSAFADAQEKHAASVAAFERQVSDATARLQRAEQVRQQYDETLGAIAGLAVDQAQFEKEKAEFDAWRDEHKDALAAARKILGL